MYHGHPDLILYGGRVITADAAFTVAEAVAVRDDRIVAVGDEDAVRRLAGSSTAEVDLHGACVLPGQIDNHVHFLLAGLGVEDVHCGKVRIDAFTSISEILQGIRRRVEDTEPGEWISTSCMYRGDLADGRFPNRWDLDQIAPDNPVYIFQSGKNVIANSLALRLAGITRDTQDPTEPEGRIVRDASGEPTGHLIAGAADMARMAWWRAAGQRPKKWDFLYYDRATMRSAIEEQQAVFHACGVTGVREMGASADEVEAYVDANRSGMLKVRTDLLLGLPTRYWSQETIADALDLYFGPPQGIGDEMLWVGGIKLVVVNDGWWAYSPEKITWLIHELNRRGWTLALHVQTGGCEEATEVVLSALEAADETLPIAGRRFSYEHGLGLLDAKDIERVRNLGMTVSGCAMLAYYGAARSVRMHETLADAGIAKAGASDGLARAVRDWGQPFRAWIDGGLRVTSGSDVPAVAYDPEHPFLAQYCALTGDTLVGPLMEGQRLSREEMVRMHTIDAAYGSFKEQQRGSIEVGKLADLAIVDRDILSCADDELPDVKVLRTYVGGEQVHEHG